MAQTVTAPPVRWALGALALAGVGISAFWLAKAATIFASPESEWVAPLPVTPAYAQQAIVPRLDVNFDAFHRAPEVEEVVDTTIGEDAPETTLNLVLVGRRSGPAGSAYIRTPDRRQDNYYVDDEIISGVTLEAVYPGHVIIRRATGLERLSMRDRAPFGAEPAEATSQPPIQRTSAPSTPRPASDPLAKIRNQYTSENPLAKVAPGDILQQASLTTAVVDGERVGMRVGSRDGADLTHFGLESGDIVTTINGIDLAEGRIDIADLYTDLQEASAVTLVVLRDGAPVTVRIGQ